MSYLVVFFFTALFAYIADNIGGGRRTICFTLGKLIKFKLSGFFLMISSAFPILMATFRDVSVGTDNAVYLRRLISISHINGIFDAAKYDNHELVINLLMYVVSRFTTDYRAFSFLTSAITIGFLMAALWKFRGQCLFVMSILAYLFMFYCYTFNIVRQGMALSISLLALAYLLEGKEKKCFVLIVLACLTHYSSIVYFASMLLYRMLYKKTVDIRLNVKFVLLSGTVVSIGVFFVIFWRQCLMLLTRIGLLSQEYYNEYIYLSQNGIPATRRQLGLYIIAALIPILFRRRLRKKYQYYDFLLLLVVLGLIFSFLVFVNPSLGRLGLFHFCPVIVLLSMIPTGYSQGNRFVIDIGIIGFLVLHWYLLTVTNGYGFTLPVYPYNPF